MNVALIIAGGRGMRMGQEIPKQFLTVNDKPVIAYTMEAFQNHPMVDKIVATHGRDSALSYIVKYYSSLDIRKLLTEDNGSASLGQLLYRKLTGVL